MGLTLLLGTPGGAAVLLPVAGAAVLLPVTGAAVLLPVAAAAAVAVASSRESVAGADGAAVALVDTFGGTLGPLLPELLLLPGPLDLFLSICAVASTGMGLHGTANKQRSGIIVTCRRRAAVKTSSTILR